MYQPDTAHRPAVYGAIDARMTNYTLKGQDYNSEVSFWLPFNGDVGIHDASWRSEFGGSIYKTRGSHGCVNTPYSAMKPFMRMSKLVIRL